MSPAGRSPSMPAGSRGRGRGRSGARGGALQPSHSPEAEMRGARPPPASLPGTRLRLRTARRAAAASFGVPGAAGERGCACALRAAPPPPPPRSESGRVGPGQWGGEPRAPRRACAVAAAPGPGSRSGSGSGLGCRSMPPGTLQAACSAEAAPDAGLAPARLARRLAGCAPRLQGGPRLLTLFLGDFGPPLPPACLPRRR